LFNLTAHELHELYYYDIGLLPREALDRLRVHLNMYLVILINLTALIYKFLIMQDNVTIVH